MCPLGRHAKAPFFVYLAKGMKMTPEQQNRLIELRAAGKPFTACAETLGISKPTAMKWAKDLAREITNARTEHTDELAQRYAIAKNARLLAFGERLQTLLAEVARRDLADVPTPTLLNLALRYGDFLRAEDTPREMIGDERPMFDLNDMTRRETWPI